MFKLSAKLSTFDSNSLPQSTTFSKSPSGARCGNRFVSGAVAQYLEAQLNANTLSLMGLQQQFHLADVPPPPPLQTQQHDLTHYDQLLYAPTTNRHDSYRDAQPAAQIPQAGSMSLLQPSPFS